MEKQEKTETVDKTLEEAAQNESEYLSDWEDKDIYKRGFIDGAKYQAERMYTEDDMRRAYSYGMFAVTTGRNFKDWFINYKSK
jgi:hypothetical protein